MTSNRRVRRTALQLEAELAAITSVGRAVNATLSVGSITEAALSEILQALRADLVVLFLRDGDQLTLEGAAPTAMRERLSDMREHRIGECICGLAARGKAAIFSRDILTDHRCTWEDCKRAGFVSFAAVPLVHGDDVIGVIGLASVTVRDFEERREFLETLAGLVTGAMANARLYETSQRELAERTHAERALRESEERLSTVFNSSHELQLLLAVDGGTFRVSAVNRHYLETIRKLGFDISVRDMIGRTVESLVLDLFGFPTRVLEWVLQHYRQAADSRAPVHYEEDMDTPGGHFWSEVTILPVLDAEGACSHILWTSHDITGRKRAEVALQESEARFRQMIECAPVPIGISGPSGRIEYVNPRFQSTFGYSLDEVADVGDWYRRAYPDAEYRGTVVDRWEQALRAASLEHRPSEAIDVRITCRDGSVRSVQVFGAFMGDRLMAVFVDLTDRTRAEESLRESEERSRILADAAFEGIAITTEGVLLDCSEQMALMLGSERRELLGRPVGEFIAPEHRDRVAAAQREGRLEPYEHLMLRVDGSKFPVEVRARSTQVAGRQLRIAAVRDLTERKRAEQALQLFQYSIDQASDAVFWMNRDGGFSYVNDQACRTLGYTRDELLQLRLWDIAPSFPQSLWYERWEGYQADRRGGAQHFEASQRRKDGAEFPVEVVSKHLWLGDVELHVAFVRDITERKRADEALRRSDVNLQLALDAARLGDWSWDILTGELVWSDRCKALYRLPQDTVMTHERFLECLHPDDRERVQVALARAVEERSEYTVEKRTVWPDGSLHWTATRGRVVCDAAGAPVRMIGVTLEITEGKRAEERLVQSHALMRYIIEHNRSAVAVHDRDMRYFYVSERYLDDFQVTERDVIGKHHYDVFPNLPQKWRDVHRQVLTGAVMSSEDDPYERADGSVEWTRWECRPWYEAEGSIGGLIVYTEVITERRRMEEALREKTEELDRFFTTTLDLLCVADTSGSFRRLNPQWEAVLGYSLAELEGSRFLDFIHPDDLDATIEAVSRLDAQQPVLNFVNRYRCRDGSYRWLEWRSTQQGGLIYAAVRDITDRKHAEAAMRESESLLRRSQAVGHVGSYYLDARTGQWICSAALNDVFGIGDDYVKDVAGWIALVHPDEKDEMLRYLREHVLAGRNRFEREYRIVRHRDGQARWVHGLGELEFDEAGNPTKMIGTIQDITVRRQAEDALRASLEEKVVLLKEVHHRVKNNLQIISSLLNLQSAKTRNSEVQDSLRDTQGRIRAMAVLHETLYGSDNLARVNVKSYVQTICAQVVRSFLSDSRDIRLVRDVADAMLPLDQAIPVGLILNELLSNAFKHAFVDRVLGEITVHLQMADQRHWVLRVADDGVGLSTGSGGAAPGSIGLLLVESLVRQLEGELTVGREAGTTFQMVFPVQPAQPVHQ